MLTLQEEATTIIKAYESTGSNIGFTIEMSRLENSNKPLFDEILNQLSTNKYNIKYLNSTGTEAVGAYHG